MQNNRGIDFVWYFATSYRLKYFKKFAQCITKIWQLSSQLGENHAIGCLLEAAYLRVETSNKMDKKVNARKVNEDAFLS